MTASPPAGTGPLPGTAAPWLAVIDLQKVFTEPDSPWFAPRAPEIIGAVGALVAALPGRVSFTRFLAPEHPIGSWRTYYDRWPFALQPPDAGIYRLVDEFATTAGHTVDATMFSKWTPELVGRVGPGGRLLLAGVSTDCCVLSTAVAAADAGAEVQVVADACAGVDDDSHRKALDILRLYSPLIEVVTLAEVLGSLTAPTPPGDRRASHATSGRRSP